MKEEYSALSAGLNEEPVCSSILSEFWQCFGTIESALKPNLRHEVERVLIFAKSVMLEGDLAHDENHVVRVALNAMIIAKAETGTYDEVIPAALLHDLVNVRKDSPDRQKASLLSARVAKDWMQSEGYEPARVASVFHCIEAHSLSAQIVPRTLEAMIVQDADRLESLGVRGIKRAIQVGNQIGRPFCELGAGSSKGFSTIEHIRQRTPIVLDEMKTATGRSMALVAAAQTFEFLEQVDGAFGLLH
jgi:uncharacterized protein